MLLAAPVLYIILLIVELVLTLPFGMSTDPSDAELKTALFWEFLITAIPAGVLTYFAAMSLNLGTFKDILIHSAVWTAFYVAINFILSAFVNHNFEIIFGTFSFYVLIVLFFFGPIVYGRVKHLA